MCVPSSLRSCLSRLLPALQSQLINASESIATAPAARIWCRPALTAITTHQLQVSLGVRQQPRTEVRAATTPQPEAHSAPFTKSDATTHSAMIRFVKIRAWFFSVAIALVCAFPCSGASSAIPQPLRGGIVCDDATIAVASALSNQGWIYIMPRPKSAQAAWGNRDGRTIWWIGYWSNKKTGAKSLKQPTKNPDGAPGGDGLGGPSWRRGGSPPLPSKIEWLCSQDGGIPPQ